MSNTRRTSQTSAQYRRRVIQLQLSAIQRRTPVEVFSLQASNPDECRNEDLLQEFKLWAPGKSRASWDLYRAAVLWHMRAALDADPSESNKKVYAELNQERFPEETPRRNLMEKKRADSIPKKDLYKLIDELLCSNKRIKNIGIKTQCWLLAALATGLRPNEWETAYLKKTDDDQWVLCVNNSKRKVAMPAHMELKFYQQKYPDLSIENRFDIESHGFENIPMDRQMTREIPVDERDLIWVENHLAGIAQNRQDGNTFSYYYDSCRQALLRACVKTFDGKKRYTLYVMRHQFAANIKNKYSQEKVAELMGHDDIGSAPKNYASRRKGYPEFRQYRNADVTPPETHAADTVAPSAPAGSVGDDRQVQG